MSTPCGTTEMLRRGTPIRISSDSSSAQAAMTALALRPIAHSSRRTGAALRLSS